MDELSETIRVAFVNCEVKRTRGNK